MGADGKHHHNKEPQSCLYLLNNGMVEYYYNFLSLSSTALSGLLGEVQSKGCIASTNCKNTTQSIFNFKLNITMHCCSTDLCNGAESGFAPLNVWAAMGTLLLAFGVNFSV
uniref:Uncharacterized protein n=1 Tax=Periophthalmus magnuspinnatus TaxID=409849 RepID=A0A3B4B5Q2_9GOBI